MVFQKFNELLNYTQLILYDNNFVIFSGNRNSMRTDFDVTMWMEGETIELIVPNPPYENGLEGLCGNNNGDSKG